MVDLIYWNIENISRDRYQRDDVREVIQNALAPVNAHGNRQWANIYVIIEVHARGRGHGPGTIYNSAGAQGFYDIFNYLHGLDNDFAAVPPITVGYGGYCEAVGVIYDTSKLTFAGPHVWSNFGPVPRNQLGLNAGNADANWATLLHGQPAGTTFNAVGYPVPWNVGPFNGPTPLPAPQIRYPRIYPPGFREFPGPDNRTPYYTQFTYQNAAHVQCTLDLFAIHTSPGIWNAGQPNGPAVAATAMIPNLAAASSRPGTNTMRLVVGDFNVPTNLHSPGYGNAYIPYAFGGYTMAIGDNRRNQGFEPRGTPTFFDKNDPRPYQNPDGSWQYLNLQSGSIDNAIYYHGRSVGINSFSVIDQVQGSPNIFRSELETALGHYNVHPYGTNSFQGIRNFGHICHRIPRGVAARGSVGASDHMPLLVQFE
tara:strand:- start:3454 stop:4725 length:1272 start_codon:yes stop_codon:yes gene_type:complete